MLAIFSSTTALSLRSSSLGAARTFPRRRQVFATTLACCWLGVSYYRIIPVQAGFGSSWSNINSMSFHTERSEGGLITVSPRNAAEQSALVVISHGLGDTAEGFVDVAEHLCTKMPHIKFILPTAPVQPVTLNGGMRINSWYDIVGLDERANEQCEGIEQSCETLLEILKNEHETNALPYKRMVVMGFSQGGALSLFTGISCLTAEQQLAGIVVMSGYLPAAAKVKVAPGLEDTPVWHGHGTQDMLVHYSLADKTKQACLEKGLKTYKVMSYPIAHTVSMEEIADVATVLSEWLPIDDTCRVKLKDPSEMSVKELKQAIRRAGLSKQAVGMMEKAEFVKLLQDHYNNA